MMLSLIVAVIIQNTCEQIQNKLSIRTLRLKTAILLSVESTEFVQKAGNSEIFFHRFTNRRFCAIMQDSNLKSGAMVMKRFRYIFFAALLAMMWLGINVYADEYDGLDFDYGSVLVQLKPQITDAVSMCSDPFEELNISDAKCIFGDDASSISLFSDKTEPIIYVLDLENPSRENVIDTIEKLKAMPNIEYAEPNYNVYEFSEPNDTYYQNGKQAVLDLIGAKKALGF